jgi:hypothetical protein
MQPQMNLNTNNNRRTATLPKFILLLLFACCGNTNAQAQLHIQATITDNAGAPINGCVVRAKKKHQSSLLHFEILAQTDRFSITLQKLRKGDTVEIGVEHMSYQTVTHTVVVQKQPQQEQLTFVLLPKAKELKEIVIRPAMWRRGDTTIFTIDSFATGAERKLKDIITKLPGFTRDSDGQLRFKDKKVEKILIEGQDLFAERTNLLLESFPIHVLSEIEAIENDPKNKLLKGLSNDNQTVINLRLKNKAHTVFGDANVTATSNRRYAVNPTLFSVQPRLKWATIGYLNNLGSDLKLLFPELQPAVSVNQLQLGLNNIFTINNFDASRYLSNRLYNQQAVIHYKPRKKLTASTEISYAQEQIVQKYASGFTLLDAAATLTRESNVAVSTRTRRGRLVQKMEWSLSPTKAIRLHLTAEGTANRFTEQQFIQQANFTDSIPSFARENSWLAMADWQYTHRIDSARAFVASYKAQWWYNRQQGFSTNNLLPLIFPSGPADANQLQLQTLPHLQHHDGQIEWLRKKSNKLFSQKIVLQNTTLALHNTLALGKLQTPDREAIPLPEWSGQGRVVVYKTGYQTAYQQLKKRKYSVNVQGYGGASWLQRTDTLGRFEGRLLPDVNFLLQYNRFLPKKQLIPLQLEGRYQPLTPEQMPAFPIPVHYNTFSQTLFPLQAIPGIKISAGYSWFPLTGNSISAQVFYERLFANEVAANRFDLFFGFQQRKLLQRGADRYGYSFNQNLIVPALRARAHFYSSAFINQYFLDAAGTTLLKISNLFLSASGSLTFDNFKKFNFYFKADIWNIRNFLPAASALAALSRPIVNYRQTANGRWIINKQTSLGVQTTWYQFDITNNPQRMLFADADFRWQPSNSKWSADLKLENLFNRQRYILTNVYPNSVSLTDIPLIGRNLQVAVRMNF